MAGTLKSWALLIILTLFCVRFSHSQENAYLMKIYFTNQPTTDSVIIANPVPIQGNIMQGEHEELLYKNIKSFSAESAPLKSILYGILSNTGINVIFDPDVDTSMTLTVRFNNIELISALNSIMQMANLAFILEGKILKVKTTLKRVYKLPYVKNNSTYTATLGGNITGGGVTGITGNYQVDFNGDPATYDLYSQIETNIRSMLSNKGSFTLNRMTGTLVVEDRPDRIKLVESFLTNIKREIDKQVLIEARIVEINLASSYQYGINWDAVLSGVLDGNMRVVQNLATSSFAGSIAVTRKDFNFLLNFLSTYGTLNVLSNPRIMVTNNQMAVITSGNIVPFWDKQINVVGGTLTTPPNTATIYQRRNILSGILLGVSPHIEDDGWIIVNIVPVSTDIQGVRQQRENGQVVAEAPIISVKEAGTTVRVKDGDTIIIGGLIDKVDKVEEQKVPLLGDIPILGSLFKQKNVSKQNRELIILMKVTRADSDKYM